MRVIDLSHPMEKGMPLFPGTSAPSFDNIATVEKDGWSEKWMQFTSHTGTHIDVPAHLECEGDTVDRLPLCQFSGPGMAVDVSHIPEGQGIPLDFIKPYEKQIRECDFVLLRSGWDRYWGEERYFEDYPVLTVEAARWLAHFSLKGIGVDMISLDIHGTFELPVHHTFFRGGMILIENLTNLDRLPGTGFMFHCFPINVIGADGSPVRAAAVVN